jgi:hypothetical protein
MVIFILQSEFKINTSNVVYDVNNIRVKYLFST